MMSTYLEDIKELQILNVLESYTTFSIICYHLSATKTNTLSVVCCIKRNLLI